MTEEKQKPKWEVMIEKANKLDEDQPGQLFEKLSIYGQVKEMYGDFEAKYKHEWKLAKAVRKEVEDTVKVFGGVLKEVKQPTNDPEKQDDMPYVEPQEAKTDKMREAIAGIIAKPYLDDENRKEALALHFENKYESISEQINIMKKRYDHLVNVARGGV